MKLGVSAFAWTASLQPSHLSVLPSLRERGFLGFEIAMFDPAALDVAPIRRAFEASEMECTVCAILPPGINPISPDPAIRRRSRDHLKICIETSAALGAKILCGPLYAPIGYLPGHRPTHDEWSWAVEIFQSLGDLLNAHQVTLAIEPVNRSETFFLRTAREANALCEAIAHPRVGVTIDTFHANIEEADIPAAILALGPRLLHLHASENHRGILGRGHVNFPAIVAALRTIGYSGYLMIEGFGFTENEKDAPGFLWADENVSPEDLAFQGFEYLEGLLTE